MMISIKINVLLADMFISFLYAASKDHLSLIHYRIFELNTVNQFQTAA